MAVSAKDTQRPARPRNWLQNKQNGQQAGSQHGRESGSQTPSADRCVALSRHSVKTLLLLFVRLHAYVLSHSVMSDS